VLGLAEGTLPDDALQAWVQQDRFFVVEERRVVAALRAHGLPSRLDDLLADLDRSLVLEPKPSPRRPPSTALRPTPSPGRSASAVRAALRSARLGRGRVARLVEAELDPAGEGDGGEQAPALVTDRSGDLDPLSLEGGHGGGDVVGHEI